MLKKIKLHTNSQLTRGDDGKRKIKEGLKPTFVLHLLLGEFSDLTVFDFNKLDYLECVLKETLRLYPSVPFLARSCVTETHMNGLILPERTQINVHVYDIMRDPNHFPDPSAFKPERFLLENSVNRHPFAFVPFSAGSRNCIGKWFMFTTNSNTTHYRST